MKRVVGVVAGLCAAFAVSTAPAATPAPPQGYQADAAFAASYAANGVVNVSATTQHVSCYAPEVPYPTALTAADGYPGGGETLCPGATTGEQTSGFATQDVSILRVEGDRLVDTGKRFSLPGHPASMRARTR